MIDFLCARANMKFVYISKHIIFYEKGFPFANSNSSSSSSYKQQSEVSSYSMCEEWIGSYMKDKIPSSQQQIDDNSSES